ncbi:MAG: helix-turn-helix domain-containing protein [Pirellulaceae bacterium]
MKRKTIAVAIYDGLLGFEYGIVAELFGLVRPGLEKSWYEFKPCRVERGSMSTTHGLTFEPVYGLKELAAANIVIVPGWRRPADDFLPHERPKPAFLESIRAAYKNGARVISVCSGVFVLGHAGLLDGRKVTAHWLHTEELQKTFPRAHVIGDSLYIHDQRISTSAGSSAGLDLCLSIIRQDFGVDVACMVARRMVAPVHREGGQSQYVEPTVLSAEDEEMGPVLDWMTMHLSETFSLNDVADRFCLSLRTFQRRFKVLTGVAPLVWINQNRINCARNLLETTDLSVEQVASRSGLGSAANLRKHFERFVGTTPSAYRSSFRSVDR